METTSIVKPKKRLTSSIKGNDLLSTIFLPAQLQDHNKPEESAEEINLKPGAPGIDFLKKYLIAPIGLVLEIIAATSVFTSHNKLQVTIGWLTLCAILVLSIYEARKNKHIYFRTNMGLGWIAIVLLQFWLGLFLLVHGLIQ